MTNLKKIQKKLSLIENKLKSINSLELEIKKEMIRDQKIVEAYLYDLNATSSELDKVILSKNKLSDEKNIFINEIERIKIEEPESSDDIKVLRRVIKDLKSGNYNKNLTKSKINKKGLNAPPPDFAGEVQENITLSDIKNNFEHIIKNNKLDDLESDVSYMENATKTKHNINVPPKTIKHVKDKLIVNDLKDHDIKLNNDYKPISNIITTKNPVKELESIENIQNVTETKHNIDVPPKTIKPNSGIFNFFHKKNKSVIDNKDHTPDILKNIKINKTNQTESKHNQDIKSKTKLSDNLYNDNENKILYNKSKNIQSIHKEKLKISKDTKPINIKKSIFSLFFKSNKSKYDDV
ncbi:MAG: hypothetical protein HRU03_01670, partial [Nanoarchaeales archaeon]|nr:hypothetical protein [Nanoarchaeales archaeon]